MSLWEYALFLGVIARCCPKGMVISMDQQQQFQAGQLQVLQMLTSIPNNANKNEENQGKQTENRNRKTDGRRNK